jgi:uncharacterized protein
MRTETATATLPLFPLNAVLFPGGRLPLRVFEARYMDMVRAAMRDGGAFGIVLIRAGREAGDYAVQTEPIGCRVRIDAWDMPQLGVLEIETTGTERFRIVDREVRHDGLIVARTTELEPEPAIEIPGSAQRCVALLERIARGESNDDDPDQTVASLEIPEPHRFDDATWVGNRLAELLPIPLPAKQRLMALTDAAIRLAVIERILVEHGMDEPA